LSDLADKLEQIKTAFAELRASPAGGPETRKQLDALFRQVHSVKAVAAADGLTDLSRAAHELENVLHSLRTGESTLDNLVLQQLEQTLKATEKYALAQSLQEGAKLFLIQTSFDPSDFDHQYQNLKARLNSVGEIISVAPQVTNDKINFRIIYATRAENLELAPDVSIEPLVNDQWWDRIVRAGKSTAEALGKDINFELTGTEIPLDDEIVDCLLHLVRNAVHHGIESRGKITIAAMNDDDQLKISVTDNGRGVDPQTIASGILFQPGFSTASEVSEISGRGVGLDVVKTTVEQRSGSVQIQSELGKGSTFTITLPSRSV
jgi:two-component system chemotaxis sensor kinase CheA